MKRILTIYLMMLLMMFVMLATTIFVTMPAFSVKYTAQGPILYDRTTTPGAIVVKADDGFTKKKTKGATSKLVYVNLKKQQISVYETIDGVKKLIKTMPCATGKPHTPTPKGLFKMKHIGKFLYDKKFNCYLKYVVRFNGSYLLHSVPVNKYGRVLDSTIGKPASHGCIRLLIKDSKWLYNLPINTAVLIE